MNRALPALSFALFLGLLNHAAQAQTLKTVRDRGFLSCGVSQGLPGFSSLDDNGNWTGLDVDACRAVAAAIFNDPSKVLFVPLPARDRFDALQSGEVDVLSRNSGPSNARDTALGSSYGDVAYYDGLGFLVRKASKIHSPLEFDKVASICVQTRTIDEKIATSYFQANDLRYEIIAFATVDEAVKAYDAGRCDTFTSEVSQLHRQRLKLANSNAHVMLSKVISKEPLGPAVRHGDEQWFDIVKCTLFAMLSAEEFGVTQINVERMFDSDKPELKLVFTTAGNLGERLGLTRDWVVRIIKAVGNFGESLDRNFSADSKLASSHRLKTPE
jgi:general L-amino acid transport system substrate-binding protein